MEDRLEKDKTCRRMCSGGVGWVPEPFSAQKTSNGVKASRYFWHPMVGSRAKTFFQESDLSSAQHGCICTMVGLNSCSQNPESFSRDFNISDNMISSFTLAAWSRLLVFRRAVSFDY